MEAEERKRREAERIQRVETEIAVERAKAETAVERVSASVEKILSKAGNDENGGWVARSNIRTSLSGKRAREHMGDALDALESAGKVESQKTDRGVLYRLKSHAQ